MAGNKFEQPVGNTLLQNKLQKISVLLRENVRNGTYQTQEALLFGAIKAMNEFYASLLEPQLPISQVQADQIPSLEDYNVLWNTLLDDLTIIFTELENVESLTVGNFNAITTDINRLTARVKLIASKLGDYILYSATPTKDAIYFKDSFNDLSKVDINSNLLNQPQCVVDPEEGIITLPLDTASTKDIKITLMPTINPSSTGVPGNNQERGKDWHGDMMPMLDGNPDTWFEYERVLDASTATKDPLVLDLVVNLETPQLINKIRINPNNFGTRTVLHVDAIETSLDGHVYTSIKDDIPLAGFTTGDEENIFVLSPSTSKYAGQGIYSFTPRQVKYVRLILRQDEWYPIETTTGDTRLRLAIGIRDIAIQGVAFQKIGEFVSQRFDTLDEIKKVSLQTNQNPTTVSELASIDYLISPDDGGSWYPIQPKQWSGFSNIQNTVPEILNFNLAVPNAIVTPAPVKGLRLKGILKRNDSAFTNGSSTFRKAVLNTAETHKAPGGDPFVIALNEAPVDGSIILVDPLYGSRGLPQWPCLLSKTNDKSTSKYTIEMPYHQPVKKTSTNSNPPVYNTIPQGADEWLHVEVAGKRWPHVTNALGTYALTDKVYSWTQQQVGIQPPKVPTAPGGSGGRGMVVEQGQTELTVQTQPVKQEKSTNLWYIEFPTNAVDDNATVAFWLEPERIYPNSLADHHLAKLEFYTSNNKNNVIIKRYGSVMDAVSVAPRQASVIRLGNQNIINFDTISGTLATLGYNNYVAYQNGRDELLSSGYWTIDTRLGNVYLHEPLATISGVLFRYLYQPITTLTTADWDWGTSEILRDSLAIKDTGWMTNHIDGETLGFVANSYAVGVSQLALVQGTVELTAVGSGVTDGTNPFAKEVPYQDGYHEFPDRVKLYREIPSTRLPSGASPALFGFTLQSRITLNTAYPIFFNEDNRTEKLFVTEKAGVMDVNNTGDFYVDRAANTVYIWAPVRVAGQDTSLPAITYYSDNPNVPDDGLYSIDYQKGMVYTQRPLLSGWSILASYDYTDYRVEYKIARIVSPLDYQVDMTNRSIKLGENEIHRLQALNSSMTKSYTVNYDYVAETRETVQDLKGLFTPVLKDYVLKIITKGKML